MFAVYGLLLVIRCIGFAMRCLRVFVYFVLFMLRRVLFTVYDVLFWYMLCADYYATVAVCGALLGMCLLSLYAFCLRLFV